MHLADVVAHLGDRLVRRLDDDVDAVAEHVEVEVGDQGRDLDQRVVLQVETGHLAVDPDQALAHASTLWPARGAQANNASPYFRTTARTRTSSQTTSRIRSRLDRMKPVSADCTRRGR